MSSGLVGRVEVSPAVLASRVEIPGDASLEDAVAALRRNPQVESVTVDERVPMLADYRATEMNPSPRPQALGSGGGSSAAADPRYPNDPILLPTLWHYNLVDAPRAWASVTGGEEVLVAVIDDGIRFDHPAIAANLTQDGYNFVAAGNRLKEGQPLCAGGTTLLSEPGYSPDPTQHDDLSWNGTCWFRSPVGNHGLHVSGTIGAQGNDGVGTTGLNWRVRIRPVRVLDIAGFGSWFDIAQGVLYAAGLPASDGKGGTVTAPSAARVINMSLGGSQGSGVLQNAVTAATNAGSLIVAAAGNSQTSAPAYPASYPEVLSVVAIGPDYQLASYTNVGAAVSLSAPGGNFRSSNTAGVASTTWNFQTNAPSYAYYFGTSMSAPHVTGVAALVLAAHPGFTSAQLRARLQNTAVHLGNPGWDDRFGFGVVNAYNAVNNLPGRPRDPFVRLYNATTGDTIRTIRPDVRGAFSFTRVAEGDYFVAAGEDDAKDGRIGIPGRRFGWYGGALGPLPITVSAAQSPNPTVSLHIGTPSEVKPNSTAAQATRLLLHGYIAAHLNVTHPEAYFMVQIPRAGSYTFETSAILGTCGFAIEADTYLTLFAGDGSTIAQNDDTPRPGSALCSSISAQLTPGTYHLRVAGAKNAPVGQFTISARG